MSTRRKPLDARHNPRAGRRRGRFDTSWGDSVVIDKNKSKSVLVYQIGSLGDTLVSIPAYRAVRRRFGPDAQILVLHNAPPDGRASPHQVLEGSGLVDGAVTFQQHGGRGTWKTWREVWSKMRRLQPDAVAYIAPGERSPKQVWRDKLFFQICGVPTLLGFHTCDAAQFHARGQDGRPLPVPNEALLRLERLEKDGVAMNRAADMAAPLLRLPVEERDQAQAWLRERQTPDTTLVAICPGANQPANFWPLERFEEIGRRLLALGGITLIVIGGPAEQEAGERLRAAWGGGINAAGGFSVLGSAALLSQCRFMVGLDTGTTHLAAAFGVPCVVLSGERNPPGQWMPLGEGHHVLRHPVPCAGCGQRVCPVPGHPCMTGLTVDQAWDAVAAANARAAGENVSVSRTPLRAVPGRAAQTRPPSS